MIECCRCCKRTNDPDRWDPEADTGRIFCDDCWPHRDERIIPLPKRLDIAFGFPDGMPDTGERVDADPANFLRDMFLLHDGVIERHKAENMVGRHTFTYGQAIIDAWEDLQRVGYLVLDGDDWTFPLQVAMAQAAR